MEQQSSSRRDSRKPLRMVAKYQTSSGLRDEGFLTDISAEGCCVTTRSMFTRTGARVVIRPLGIEALSGTIRWIEGNRAGIEFERPLYGPVVDHLAALYSDGQAVSVSRN
jgi:hypothetical protein